MYWRAENAHLWRAFWQLVQSHALGDGLRLPALTPPEELPERWADHWLSPDLALSMTCSLPFRTALRGRVRYVGTLGFGLKAPGGHYFSRIVGSKETFDAYQRLNHAASLTAYTSENNGIPLNHKSIARPKRSVLDTPRLAFNAPDSQSGWAVTQHTTPSIAPLAFSAFVQTGSHEASLQAVIDGKADIAYIDAVTWRLLKRAGLKTDAFQLYGKSISTPGLPLITSLTQDPAPLRRALKQAIWDMREKTGPNFTAAWSEEDFYAIGGPLSFHQLDEEAYLSLPIPAPPPL